MKLYLVEESTKRKRRKGKNRRWRPVNSKCYWLKREAKSFRNHMESLDPVSYDYRVTTWQKVERAKRTKRVKPGRVSTKGRAGIKPKRSTVR